MNLELCFALWTTLTLLILDFFLCGFLAIDPRSHSRQQIWITLFVLPALKLACLMQLLKHVYNHRLSPYICFPLSMHKPFTELHRAYASSLLYNPADLPFFFTKQTVHFPTHPLIMDPPHLLGSQQYNLTNHGSSSGYMAGDGTAEPRGSSRFNHF